MGVGRRFSQFFNEYWTFGPTMENCVTLISFIGFHPKHIGK